MAISNPSPERFPVISFVGIGADLVFWEKVDMKFQRVMDLEIGTPHWDTVRYPNHKLVFKTPLDSGGQWYKFFYAADRKNQEEYNYEFTGEQLSRAFLVPRSKYFASTESEAASVNPIVEDEFTRPIVGTADSRFSSFVYAEDTLARTETELDSIYVLVRQNYVPKLLISYQWDDVLQRVIKITKEVVPAKSQTGSGTYGVLVEIQPVNVFYDLKITSEVQWLESDLDNEGNPVFPIQIDSVAGDANYQFPLLLKSIKIFGAWAIAQSEAPPDYAEDFFFETDIVEPAPGPYDATVLRFITDNPNAVRALYPTTQIATRAETFGMVKWWAFAHSQGNRAFALARQYNTPATVHDVIELPSAINYVQGGSSRDSGFGPGSKTIPATPNFQEYISSSSVIAGVDTRRSRLGLWEVQVTIINAGGSTVYQNDQESSRTVFPGTGSGIIDLGDYLTANSVSIFPETANEDARISPSNLGGEYVISITGKTDQINGPAPQYEILTVSAEISWRINDSWIHADPSMPAIIYPYREIDDVKLYTYYFKISYDENTTGAPRTGTITFTNTATKTSKTFTLIQPG